VTVDDVVRYQGRLTEQQAAEVLLQVGMRLHSTCFLPGLRGFQVSAWLTRSTRPTWCCSSTAAHATLLCIQLTMADGRKLLGECVWTTEWEC
jgi:hypothetical protein